MKVNKYSTNKNNFKKRKPDGNIKKGHKINEKHSNFNEKRINKKPYNKTRQKKGLPNKDVDEDKIENVTKVDYVLNPKKLFEQKKQLQLQERKIRDDNFKKSKKEKIIRNVILNKKTKRGQPLMKDRLQLMYEKIQKSVGNS